jgi:hypothetical protein
MIFNARSRLPIIREEISTSQVPVGALRVMRRQIKLKRIKSAILTATEMVTEAMGTPVGDDDLIEGFRPIVNGMCEGLRALDGTRRVWIPSG